MRASLLQLFPMESAEKHVAPKEFLRSRPPVSPLRKALLEEISDSWTMRPSRFDSMDHESMGITQSCARMVTPGNLCGPGGGSLTFAGKGLGRTLEKLRCRLPCELLRAALVRASSRSSSTSFLCELLRELLCAASQHHAVVLLGHVLKPREAGSDCCWRLAAAPMRRQSFAAAGGDEWRLWRWKSRHPAGETLRVPLLGLHRALRSRVYHVGLGSRQLAFAQSLTAPCFPYR